MTTFNRVVEVLKNFFTGLLVFVVSALGAAILLAAMIHYEIFILVSLASIFLSVLLYFVGKDIRHNNGRS